MQEPDAFDIIEKIDYLQPLADGALEFRIEPRLGRLDGSTTMVAQLSRKVQFYLDQLNHYDYRQSYGEPPAEKTLIVLVCPELPNKAIVEFAEYANTWVTQHRARFIVRYEPVQ